MKTYDVSFLKNGIYQSNLVKAYNEEAIRKWFDVNEPDAEIINISFATADSLKPGKPVITIE